MSALNSDLPCHLFRAPWIIPITSPVIKDGAVVMNRDIIVAVGSYSNISSRFPGIQVTECSGVIMPALVNAHIHLDLSIYGPVEQESSQSTMCDWISKLLKKRINSEFSEDEIIAAAETIAQKQYESGVGLMLNVTNSDLGTFDSCPARIESLLEILGPSKPATQTAITVIEKLPKTTRVTGHAPYSTTPELLSYIKERCKRNNSVFSIHLAENPDESLLLTNGSGCFAQFLKDRGADSDTFPIKDIDGNGVTGYLGEIAILDDKSICVHCVHLSEEEIVLIAESKAHVCLCPGSNDFLNVGTAPLEKLLDQKILPALGTDSITSNPAIDMWNEMSLLRRNHPSVSADTILSIATIGGAQAMHQEKDFGSLENGCTSSILHIQDSNYKGITKEELLVERLVSEGHPESIEWLTVS